MTKTEQIEQETKRFSKRSLFYNISSLISFFYRFQNKAKLLILNDTKDTVLTINDDTALGINKAQKYFYFKYIDANFHIYADLYNDTTKQLIDYVCEDDSCEYKLLMHFLGSIPQVFVAKI